MKLKKKGIFLSLYCYAKKGLSQTQLQICKFSQFLNISECSELPEECSKIVNGFFVKEYKSNVMYQ